MVYRSAVQFIAVARVVDLAPGSCKVVEIEHRQVAVFNVEGMYHAVADGCVRTGESLGNGKLDGNIVTCIESGWRYDVTTGQLIGVPGISLDILEVKVSAGVVHVVANQPLQD